MSATARRTMMIALAVLILLSAAVLWLDAALNEGLSLKSLLLAAAFTMSGIVFLALGIRSR